MSKSCNPVIGVRSRNGGSEAGSEVAGNTSAVAKAKAAAMKASPPAPRAAAHHPNMSKTAATSASNAIRQQVVRAQNPKTRLGLGMGRAEASGCSHEGLDHPAVAPPDE
eukprot:869654-Prorocentrum_minimum.AAC.1